MGSYALPEDGGQQSRPARAYVAQALVPMARNTTPKRSAIHLRKRGEGLNDLFRHLAGWELRKRFSKIGWDSVAVGFCAGHAGASPALQGKWRKRMKHGPLVGWPAYPPRLILHPQPILLTNSTAAARSFSL
jgi:hypothetical protein